MKLIGIIAFIALAVIQWIVPGKMIFDRENILKNGKTFRFRAEPIDPENPFTGKYIYLQYRETKYFMNQQAQKNLGEGKAVYVLLTTDSNGFAKINGLEIREPRPGSDYVKAKTLLVQQEKPDLYSARIEYPFTEFYMDEYKAPLAERAYQASGRDSTISTYALVTVLNGKAVLKDVMMHDSSISNLIKARMIHQK